MAPLMNVGSTRRQRDFTKALRALLPLAPLADAESIRLDAGRPHMRALPASIAVWLATVAHVRHQHTEYDSLLDEGYDRDAARFFTVDAVNRTLTSWRSTRLLKPDAEES